MPPRPTKPLPPPTPSLGDPTPAQALAVIERLREDLADIRTELRTTEAEGTPFSQRWKRNSRRWIAALVVAVLLLGIVVGGFVWLYQRQNTNCQRAAASAQVIRDLFGPYLEHPVDNPYTPQDEIVQTRIFKRRLVALTRPADCE